MSVKIIYMQKIISLLLVIFSNLTLAENKDWTLLHTDSEHKKTFYINLGQFSFVNGKTRMWIMENYESKQIVGSVQFFSIKSLVQFDCNQNLIRILAYSLYDKKNAGGNAIFSKSKPMEWGKVKLNTINSAYKNVACQEANSS